MSERLGDYIGGNEGPQVETGEEEPPSVRLLVLSAEGLLPENCRRLADPRARSGIIVQKSPQEPFFMALESRAECVADACRACNIDFPPLHSLYSGYAKQSGYLLYHLEPPPGQDELELTIQARYETSYGQPAREIQGLVRQIATELAQYKGLGAVLMESYGPQGWVRRTSISFLSE